VEAYNLDVSSDGFVNFVPNFEGRLVTNTTEVITGLVPGVTYEYRLRASIENALFSDHSNVVSATTGSSFTLNPFTNISTNGFTLSWEAVTDATGYAVDIATDVGFASLITDAATVSTNTFEATGLAQNTEYFARVRATDGTTLSANTNVVSGTTFQLEVPVASAASNIGHFSFTANWEAVDGVNTYRLDVSTDGFISLTPGYDDLTVMNTSHAVSGLTPGNKYEYRVRAYDGVSIFSANSNVIGVSTENTMTLLPLENIGAGNLTMSWQAVVDASSYKVDVATDDTFASLVIDQQDVTATSFEVTGLTATTQYYARVRATDGTLFSSYSNTVSATTLLEVPATPTDLTADGSDGTGIALNWVDNADNEVDFVIERADDGTTFTEIATVVADAASYLDATALVDVSYSYRLAARNTAGTSPYSNEATASKVAQLPASPSDLTADGSDGSGVRLNWTDNADNEEDFAIARSDDGELFVVIETAVADAVSFLDETAVVDISYFYRVVARNSGGSSAPSNEVTASRVAQLPAAPSDLTADGAGGSGVTLNWTDNADNEADFTIERADDGATFSEIANALADATTYTDATATASNNYSYRVAARNSGGMSDYSNVAAFLITEVEDERLTKAIAISPNPSGGLYTLRVDNIKVNNILIWNAVGQLVMRKIIDVNETVSSWALDIRDEDAGLYVLQINLADNRTAFRRLIKD
jgi:titin